MFEQLALFLISLLMPFIVSIPLRPKFGATRPTSLLRSAAERARVCTVMTFIAPTTFYLLVAPHPYGMTLNTKLALLSPQLVLLLLAWLDGRALWRLRRASPEVAKMVLREPDAMIAAELLVLDLGVGAVEWERRIPSVDPYRGSDTVCSVMRGDAPFAGRVLRQTLLRHACVLFFSIVGGILGNYVAGLEFFHPSG